MRAWLAHDTPSIVAKNDIVIVFGGQKCTLGGPFGRASVLLGIFEKISQCKGEARGFGMALRHLFWGSVKDVVFVHNPPK